MDSRLARMRSRERIGATPKFGETTAGSGARPGESPHVAWILQECCAPPDRAPEDPPLYLAERPGHPAPARILPPHEHAMRLQGTTVLFFAGPLYEDLELWYPKIRLEEEGARTVVAGTGERTYQGKRGYPLTVDADVEDLKADQFDGLVIPGGYAPDVMRRSKKLLQLTREIYEADKPVAFICHAGWVPISAGIVRNKRGTSVGAIRDDLVNAGMLWEDSAVVVDGNLISSRTPADLPQFMRALIRALEAGRPVLAEPLAGAR